MAEKNAHLEVSGLTKRFGGLVAVKDMAFNVDAGKILGLIGPNGSGKSTVMKLIMGIERPDAGSGRIQGPAVARWPAPQGPRLTPGRGRCRSPTCARSKSQKRSRGIRRCC